MINTSRSEVHYFLSLQEKIIKQLIVIAGPTASGKTALSVALAKHYSCSIISADSRQFYKEMHIGTAKPSVEEMEGIPHYFIDSHSIHSPLSAGQFADEATLIMERLFSESDTVILVGGSGLFIRALIDGIDELPGDEEVRAKWNALFKNEGIEILQEKLAQQDPEYFEEVDRNNPIRLVRALEVIELTGTTYSSLRRGRKKQNPFKTHYFVVNHTREILYERINRRVDIMMEHGLEKEARDLHVHKENQALNTVGYKELFDYFDGKINIEEAVHLIKQNSRRYAKRQITWFKSLDDAVWGKPEELYERIIENVPQ